MNKVSFDEVINEIDNSAVLVDVREPKEFNEKKIEGSINIPSTNYSPEDYTKYENKNIYLICQTGNRAGKVYQNLTDNGIKNVFVTDKHLSDFNIEQQAKGWTIDRQFRMLLGTLLTLFVAGYFLNLKWAIIIPIILATGLVFTSLIDRCYLRMGIAMLPWNKGKNE